jgi:hypothetical protein
MCSFKDLIVDSTVGEVYAAWKEVEFSRDISVLNIMLEGDAMKIVNALRIEKQFWSRYGQLIKDAKLVLKGLRSWNVRHVRREANMAAHRLAKTAIRQSLEKIKIIQFSNEYQFHDYDLKLVYLIMYMIPHYLKNLKDMWTLTSYTLLEVSILNHDYEINIIHFIWNGNDPIATL